MKKNNGLNKSDYDNKVIKNIYTPFLIGASLLFFGFLIIPSITANIKIAEITIYIGLIIMGLSGYWQIKYKVVPGMPTWRGGLAVISGIFYLVVLPIVGIIAIWITVFNK